MTNVSSFAGASVEEEIRDLAGRMLRLASQLGQVPASEVDPALLTRLARNIYKSRRKRTDWFKDVPFGEPAWDILLDLYASEGEGKTVTVSSACIAAAVPATTGFRYLELMEEKEQIERIPSNADKRKIAVRLSDDMRLRMGGYLAQLGELMRR